MSDYISREEAVRIVEDIDTWCAGWRDYAKDKIAAIPAADVRPVVKAKWEWNDNNGYYYCGNCEAVSPREDQYGEYIDCPNYCPNCGAKMDGES